MASTTITIYTRVRGRWRSRMWMTLARLPGVSGRRRLRWVSNGVGAIRIETRVGRRGEWRDVGARIIVEPEGFTWTS